jgi:hypothetical protein
MGRHRRFAYDEFFEKRVKKIKFEKEVPIWKISKKGY